jgi:hypothetical protein
MSRSHKPAVRIWPVCLVFLAIAVRILSLSLDLDFNLEIPISQSHHSIFAKISKESKQNQGSQRNEALAITWLHYAPSIYPFAVLVADQRVVPASYLLNSAAVRGPPAASSI